MATELDLVNAALQRVGARPVAAIDDTTPGGRIAGDVLAFERDDLLRSHVWNFSVARADLTPLAQAPTFEFTNAFGLPNDWVRTVTVHDKTDPTDFIQYKMETVNVTGTWTRAVCADSSDIFIKYVRKVTEVDLMSAMFHQALILRLARVFASGFAQSNSLVEMIDAEFNRTIQQAKLVDEIEDYPDALDSSHWGAEIVNYAIQRISVLRDGNAQAAIPSGILAARMLEAEHDALLRSHVWNFAVARRDLTPTVATPVFEYTNAFALPPAWIRTISVHDKTDPTISVQYKMETLVEATVETRVIVSDATDLVIRYVRKATDATLMTPNFKQVLALRLARAWASSLPNSGPVLQTIGQELQEAMTAARLANEFDNYPETIDETHWGSSIIKAALRRVSIVRTPDAEAIVPSGILAAELLDQERDALLRSHNWNFAMATDNPTPLGISPSIEFTNAFAVKNDWLRTVTVHDGADPTISVQYRMETINNVGTWTQVISTDATSILVRYVRRVDTVGLMSASFVKALTLRMAKAFALALPNGGAQAQALEAEFLQEITQARRSDEFEDYPASIDESHWGASIVKAALRRVSIVKSPEGESLVSPGILTAELLELERDTLLRAYTWRFSVTRADLTPLVEVPAFEYAVAYGLPADWLRTISVVLVSDPTVSPQYKMETISVLGTFTSVIASDAAGLHLRYVRQVSDAALMAPNFKQALVLRLAKAFALALPNGAAQAQAFEAEYQQVLAAARRAEEIEDYPESIDSTHWGASIVHSALRRVSAVRNPEGEIVVPAGILTAELLETERDALLRAHLWNFAIARADLATAATAPTFEYTNSFALPADWLRTITVHDKTDPTLSVQYKVETVNIAGTWTQIIATNATDIFIRYVRKVTTAALMTANFKQALSLKLAKILALALPNGAAQAQAFEAEYGQVLAAALQANEYETYPESLDEAHWGSSIIKAALRRVSIVKRPDGEALVPAGILAAELLDTELDTLLRAYNWNFAIARANLTPVVGATPVFEYTNAFAMPNNWLRTISVHDNADPTLSVQYKMESVFVSPAWVQVLATDAADVYIRYVRSITADPGLMTANFRKALILRMAKAFALGLPNGGPQAQAFEAEFQQVLTDARRANEIETYPESIDSTHWGATIVHAALRRVSAFRTPDGELMVPAGILTAELLDQERDALLRSHTWNFAINRVRLSRLSVVPAFEWKYAYALPADWLRTVSVHDNDAGSGQLCYKQESILTPELIVNGGFDADATWVKGTGWTIANGVATHANGVQSDMSQPVSPVSGKTYRVTFTVSGMNLGFVRAKFITGGPTLNGVLRNEDGFYAEDFTLTTQTTFALDGSTTFDGSIDNVSMVRIDGTQVAVPAIMADAEDVFLRYVRRVADVALFSPSFTQLLTLKLAKTIANSTPGAAGLVQVLDGEIRSATRQARSVDGMEDTMDQVPEGSWIRARHGYGGYRDPFWPR